MHIISPPFACALRYVLQRNTNYKSLRSFTSFTNTYIFQKVDVKRIYDPVGNCRRLKTTGGFYPDDKEDENKQKDKLSRGQKLKQAVKDYGSTVIVFHVGISLLSLGICYLAVDNGLDVGNLLTKIGISQEIVASKIAKGGSTFVIAYAFHKVFAPVRIGITLTATPIIVSYLRRVGFLKLHKVIKSKS